LEENDHAIHDEMEAALRRLGVGGPVEEIHLEEVLDPETGAVKQVKRKRTTKFLRPDYRALIFWLTNRMPKRWTAKAQKDAPPADSEDDSQWCDDDWTA